MMITKINLTLNNDKSKKLATGEIIIDDVLTIKGVNVFKGKKGQFFSKLPQMKDRTGNYSDICFTNEKILKREFNHVIVEQYKRMVA